MFHCKDTKHRSDLKLKGTRFHPQVYMKVKFLVLKP
jgi:hypothetical protein